MKLINIGYAKRLQKYDIRDSAIQRSNAGYRRGTDVLKILLKIDGLNRDFGRF